MFRRISLLRRNRKALRQDFTSIHILLSSSNIHCIPFHAYCFSNRNYTTKQPIDFRKNTEQDEQAEQHVHRGLSGMLVLFFQRESKKLRDTLNIDNVLENELDMTYTDILPALKARLQQEMDDYGRFALLLTYPMVHVPPELMMEYYLKLPEISPKEQTLLLKYLVFYNRWFDFWLVAILDGTTMSGIEDTVDLLFEQLEHNCNLELGIWQALAAAYLISPSAGLLNAICENVEYRLGLEKGSVDDFFQYLFSLQNSNRDLMKINEPTKGDPLYPVKMAFYLRKLDLHVIESFLDGKTLLDIPGLASFLLEKRTSKNVANTFLRYRSTCLNDLDCWRILRAGPNMYLLFLLIFSNIKRGNIKNDHVVSAAVDHTLKTDPALAAHMVAKFTEYITLRVWVAVLPVTDICVLRRLHKTRPTKLEKVAEVYLAGKDVDERTLFMLIDLHDLLLARVVFKRLQWTAENLDRLLDRNLPRGILLEAMRHVLQARLIIPQTFVLIDRIFCATWKPEYFSRKTALDILERKQNSNVRDDDFRAYFAVASDRQRQLLIYSIGGIAKAISKMSPQDAAHMLNDLNRFINSDDFTFVRSETGRTYIFNKMVNRIMRHIYISKKDPRKGVQAIRNMLALLDFDSPVTQAALFEHIVMDNPQLGMVILQNYRKNKKFLVKPLMEGIQMGILRSQFSPKERLAHFNQFRITMKDLGYTGGMGAETTAKYCDLVLAVEGNSRLQWAVELALKRGVPLGVIRKWRKRIDP